jgi:hypothetical protein
MTGYLTTTQLAKRWSYHPFSVYRMRWEGKGPTYKTVNGRIYYKRTVVERFELNYFGRVFG